MAMIMKKMIDFYNWVDENKEGDSFKNDVAYCTYMVLTCAPIVGFTWAAAFLIMFVNVWFALLYPALFLIPLIVSYKNFVNEEKD